MSDDYELYHHGIKGQKWGIRRYQPYPKGEKPKGAKEIGRANKFASGLEKKIKANPEKYRKRQSRLENSKFVKKLGESANKKLTNSKRVTKQKEQAKSMRDKIEKSSFFKKALSLGIATGDVAPAILAGNHYVHHVLQPQTSQQQSHQMAQHLFNTSAQMQNHMFNQQMHMTNFHNFNMHNW